MQVYLDHIKVKFEYQGHWVKVKVILEKNEFYLFELVNHLYVATRSLIRSRSHIKVKVTLRSK